MSSTHREPGCDNDGSLLRRYVVERSEGAAAELYLRYSRRLLAFTRSRMGASMRARIEADDIVQSVFRTFFRRAGRGDFDIPDGGELWRLFLVVALNKLRNSAVHHHAAKRDARREGGVAGLDVVADPRADAGKVEAMAALREIVDQVLASLDPGSRRMIELRLDGLEVAEIAARVNRAKRSVERVLQAFRAEMESRLHDNDRAPTP